MKALITGASSGIGKDMAIILSNMGYDLVLVARRKEKLEEIKENLNVDVQIITLDLSSTFNCMKLYNKVKKQNIAVTAILPGAMPTREDIKAQIKGQGLWGRLAAKSPNFVAEYSLKAVRKNKRKAIPGFWNKVMRISTALLPTSWKLKFIAKRWSKLTKDAF